MPRKQINPSYVQNIQVSIQDFSGQLNGGASGMVLDDSQHQISSLDSTIKATMANIVSIVQNLDATMNNVATAYQSVDADIASQIEANTTYVTPASARTSAADTSLSDSNQQNRASYKELP